MGSALGIIILICLLNESIKASEVPNVNERDKRLKVMFSNFQESKHHNDEFQPNVNSTIISRIWELFNHCFLTFDNLAKLIQNDHALK
ncbi:unnamed protein product [Schistosoma curassoni]|nr:unnamed protein product [Schistosoma curassoni]